MGIDVYASFELTKGSLDFKKLVDLSNESENVKDTFVVDLIDIENKEIKSIRGESFYTEIQESFLELIQECLSDDGELFADIECLQADYHAHITITKDNIEEEDISDEDNEDEDE